jgi:hypothetical protein
MPHHATAQHSERHLVCICWYVSVESRWNMRAAYPTCPPRDWQTTCPGALVLDTRLWKDCAESFQRQLSNRPVVTNPMQTCNAGFPCLSTLLVPCRQETGQAGGHTPQGMLQVHPAQLSSGPSACLPSSQCQEQHAAQPRWLLHTHDQHAQQGQYNRLGCLSSSCHIPWWVAMAGHHGPLLLRICQLSILRLDSYQSQRTDPEGLPPSSMRKVQPWCCQALAGRPGMWDVTAASNSG